MSPELSENDRDIQSNAVDSSQASEINVPAEAKPTGNGDPSSGYKSIIGEGNLSPPPALKIDPESVPEKIHVGAGGKLIIEREDMNALLDDGEDLDTLAPAVGKIRKPHRREWFMLHKLSEILVLLLQHKRKPNDLETEYFYLARDLRNQVRDELTLCRVFNCHSIKTNEDFLWIVHAHPGLSWYDSIQALLSRPEEFFTANRVRVFSKKEASRYQVRFKPDPVSVTWPDKTTEELLAEALGEERMISDANHPLYQDLIDGRELA